MLKVYKVGNSIKNGQLLVTNAGNVSAHLATAIGNGNKHNVSICVLLSPHYVPQWFWDKYPEIKTQGGLLSEHPKMRALLEAHIRTATNLLSQLFSYLHYLFIALLFTTSIP